MPGVPYEMSDMFERAIAPDLQERMAERGELSGTIASRVIRTWGMSESGLAEALASYIDGLDEAAGADPSGGTATIVFLASGIEGIKVRVTVRSADEAGAAARRSTGTKRPSGRSWPRSPATWCSGSTARPSRTRWPGCSPSTGSASASLSR